MRGAQIRGTAATVEATRGSAEKTERRANIVAYSVRKLRLLCAKDEGAAPGPGMLALPGR